ncbi:VWA domain-containing protein [Coralliovum pocilloporae]|uniref:VWA domain-containing protein n=1 Tax=Coralliovum pocilloporae TaxID=3066369 RepID=UPI0033072E3A
MIKKPSVPNRTSESGVARQSTSGEIDAFLSKAAGLQPASSDGAGRLIFALDATMSRQPTWDSACVLQADMFREALGIGGLAVQLVYFRGMGECRAGKWVSDGDALASLMSRIDCRGGHTQIRKVLAHALKETGRQPVRALIYVGDCMEEDVDLLCARAGELGLKGVKAFMFQEGFEPSAERAFREIARLTSGAYCRFDAGAADQLRRLLKAVAAYAAGGFKALEAKGGSEPRLLLEQMKGNGR